MCKKPNLCGNQVTLDRLLMDIVYMLNDKSKPRKERTQHAITDRLAGTVVVNHRGQVIPDVTRSYLQRTIQVALMPHCVQRAYITLATRGDDATPFRVAYSSVLYKAWNADGKKIGKHFRAAWRAMGADPFVTVRLRRSEWQALQRKCGNLRIAA